MFRGQTESSQRVKEQAETSPASVGLGAHIFTTETLEQIPDLEPLVEHWLPRDVLARVIGQPGSYKSFLCLDIAGAVGTGVPWQGQFKVSHGPVLYLVAEGHRGLRKRVRAWEQHHGRPMTGVHFLTYPAQVTSTEWVEVNRLAAGIQPVLVVLDTQARITVGVEENSNTEMGTVIQRLDHMRRDLFALGYGGACVLLVHHQGKGSTGARGASSVLGALQTELTVTRQNGAVTLGTDKQKDDAEHEDLTFDVVPVNTPAGDSVVLVAQPPANLVNGFVVPVGTATQRLEQLMSETFAHGMGGTKGEIKGLALEKLGMSKSGFYGAWNDLVDARRIGRVKGTQSWRYTASDLE